MAALHKGDRAVTEGLHTREFRRARVSLSMIVRSADAAVRKVAIMSGEKDLLVVVGLQQGGVVGAAQYLHGSGGTWVLHG